MSGLLRRISRHFVNSLLQLLARSLLFTNIFVPVLAGGALKSTPLGNWYAAHPSISFAFCPHGTLFASLDKQKL